MGVAELKTATDRTSPGGFADTEVAENAPSKGAWEGSCGTKKQQRTVQAQEDLQTRKWLKMLLVRGLGRGVAELQ